MYVHLGGDLSISDRWIIAIFDLDELDQVERSKLAFWRQAELDGRVEILSESIPQSLVLTLDRIYLSPLTAKTLGQRLEMAKSKLRQHRSADNK